MAKKEEKARKSKKVEDRRSSTDKFSQGIDDALGWDFGGSSSGLGDSSVESPW